MSRRKPAPPLPDPLSRSLTLRFVCQFDEIQEIGRFSRSTYDARDRQWDDVFAEATRVWNAEREQHGLTPLADTEVAMRLYHLGEVVAGEAYQRGKGMVPTEQIVPGARRRVVMECPRCRHRVVWTWDNLEKLFAAAPAESHDTLTFPV